jgi:hypothetical protein
VGVALGVAPLRKPEKNQTIPAGAGDDSSRSATHAQGINPMSFDHVCDDLLWKYSIGVLEEPELGQVEEHLLICQDCRARLTEFDNSWGLHG